MKKLFFLSLIAGVMISTSVNAQSSTASGPKADAPKTSAAPATPDRADMLQQMKAKFKMPMVEKTGLTEAQAERIIEINLDIRLEASAALQGLNDADRSKKLAEFKAEKEKRYAAIPLSQEQIKSVYAFYEDMGRNMQK